MSRIKWAGNPELESIRSQGGRIQPKNGRLEKMFDYHSDLRPRQLLAMIFAILSGISAVSTAVLPAILHF
jgi:hypothetical protein